MNEYVWSGAAPDNGRMDPGNMWISHEKEDLQDHKTTGDTTNTLTLTDQTGN